MKHKKVALILVVITVFSIAVWFGLHPISKTSAMKSELLDGRDNVLKELVLLDSENQPFPLEDGSRLPERKRFIYPSLMSQNQPSIRTKNSVVYAVAEGSGSDPTVVYENGKTVWRDWLVFTSYSPVRVKFVTGDLFVMSFDKLIATNDAKNEGKVERNIVYGSGREVNKSYGFDNSFSPASLGPDSGKFYFFAQKGEKYYLVQDDKKFELPYELIIDPPCCSPAIFQIITGVNKVGFYARKEGVWRYVEVDVIELFR